MSRHPRLVPVLVPALLVAAATLPASAATVLPDFSAARFIDGALIDNTYLPLRIGARNAQVAHGVEDGEPFVERDVQKVLGPGPKILGVRTTTVLDKSFEDGLLTERTEDYYAQDTEGNVWYLGEDSVSFEYDDDGNLIEESKAGSWRAGRNDALPGYAMPARLDLGFEYYQEFAPDDDALDRGLTFAILDSLRVGDTTYAKVLQVFETTELEPTAREFKFYAPDFGLIRIEEGLDENLSNPELTFDVAPIPLPPAFALLAAGLASLAALRRRPRGHR